MAAGISVFPVDGKMPVKTASGLRAKWSEQSTTDTAMAIQWTKGYWNPAGETSEHRKGIGIDCGKSGVVVIDVDRPSEVPQAWWGILNMVPFTSTDSGENGRGHYYFAQPEDGIGCPKAPWGEVKGIGGYVILPPSPHAAADLQWPDKQTPEKKYRASARYLQTRSGPLHPLPALIAGAFGEHRQAKSAASVDEISAFVERCRGGTDQYLLGNIAKTFFTKTDNGEGRHPTMQACLVWAAKAAAGGLIPADLAHDTLESAFIKVKGDEAFPTEFEDMWEWAIGQATQEETAAFMAARAEHQLAYEAEREDTIPQDPNEDIWLGIVSSFHLEEDPEYAEGEPAPERPKPVTTDDGGLILPAPSKPYNVGEDLQTLYWMKDGKSTLRHWRGDWMMWTGTCWKPVQTDDFNAMIYKRVVKSSYYLETKKDGPKLKPWDPTKSKITNLEHAMRALCNLPAVVEPGSWIGQVDRSSMGTVVSCANGLLRVKDRRLAAQDPDFFNFSALPFDYISQAGCPQWEAFLARTFEHDPAAILTLQEWFGYVVSGRTDLQKMFQIIGPPRSGKGTIARVLEQIVGDGNYCGPTLAGMMKDFGLASLVSTSLAIIGDARLQGRGTGEIVERLLSLSGGDTLNIGRKYKEDWKGKVPARIMLLSNEIPNFGDSAGAIPKRWISIQTRESHYGKEDITLGDKLKTELSGILNWALDGLDRLTAKGDFTETVSGKEVFDLQSEGASPVAEFAEEMCTIDPTATDEDCWVVKSDLVRHFDHWMQTKGYGESDTNVPRFSRMLKSVFPGVKVSNCKRRINNSKIPVYVGIKLNNPMGLLVPLNSIPSLPDYVQDRME
jgi:putative DNA primase/helicase